MQHAIGSRPDPAHGYCTDDVARALMSTCSMPAALAGRPSPAARAGPCASSRPRSTGPPAGSATSDPSAGPGSTPSGPRMPMPGPLLALAETASPRQATPGSRRCVRAARRRPPRQPRSAISGRLPARAIAAEIGARHGHRVATRTLPRLASMSCSARPRRSATGRLAVARAGADLRERHLPRALIGAGGRLADRRLISTSACGSSTGSSHRRPPGRRLLADRQSRLVAARRTSGALRSATDRGDDAAPRCGGRLRGQRGAGAPGDDGVGVWLVPGPQ